MTEIVRSYYVTYKAMEDMALDLADLGMTDAPAYRKYADYKQGYELARAELLESLGIETKGI